MNGVAAGERARKLPEQFRRQASPRHATSTWVLFGSARTAPQRLGQHWFDLSANASEPNAFAEPWFAAAALRDLDPHPAIQIPEVWSGEPSEPSLIGLLPLCVSRGYGRIPVKFA